VNTTEKQNYAAAFLNAAEVSTEEQSTTLLESDMTVGENSVQIGKVSCTKLIGTVTILLKGRPIFSEESTNGVSFVAGEGIPIVFDEIQIALTEESDLITVSDSSVYSII
tara:strand:+ start:68809 stop:69138 length:330 start_codon:yes stop_codon:yes gene_type:complete